MKRCTGKKKKRWSLTFLTSILSSHCVFNNRMITQENHRFSTTFEGMQDEKEKQKAKYFLAFVLTLFSRSVVAFQCPVSTGNLDGDVIG